MLNKVLTTPVDNLVELVKNNENCSISFLVSNLKVPTEIIEKWLVILEEYKVLTVNYRGFEGYVNVFKNKEEKLISDKIDIDNLKSTFLKKCYNSGFSSDKIENLWKLFIKENEIEIKKLFDKNAKLHNYKKYQIEKAWVNYKKDLEKL